MAKKKRKWSPWWGRRKPKPIIDHSRPFHEQIKQLQEHIDKEPKSNLVIDEVIISQEQIKKIIWAWLYEPAVKQRYEPVAKHKQRLMWLMLLYSNPNVANLAKRLSITKAELLESLKELKRLEP